MPVIIVPTGITAWSAIFPYVQQYASQAPTFVVEDALKEVAREFFSASLCWRDSEIALLTTVSGQHEYAYSPPSGKELVAITSAWNGTTEWRVLLPGDDEDAYTAELADEPAIYVVSGGESIALSPAPASSDLAITGTVAWTPAVNGAGIPTWAFNSYKQQLAAGAAAQLCIQDDRPWTRPERYAGLRKMFEDGMTSASNGAGPVRRVPLRVKAW